MSNFNARLDKLEKNLVAKFSEPQRWHRVIQDVDQSQAEAITEYECENGRIGPDDGKIIWRLVAPDRDRSK